MFYFLTHRTQRNCMARRDAPAPRPAIWGPLVTTPALPRRRFGQRRLEPESLRSRGICVENEDVCKAQTEQVCVTCPPKNTTPDSKTAWHGGTFGKRWAEQLAGSRAGNGALDDSVVGKIEIDRRSDGMNPSESAQCRFGQNSQFSHHKTHEKSLGDLGG